MATYRNFEELEIFKLAREAAKDIFVLTQSAPFSKDFEHVRQINKSAGSTMDNIAEGFERGGNKEFIYFLGISKGSTGEVRSQLIRAFDKGYLDEDTFHRISNKAITLNKQINGFMAYLDKSDMKGMKFHEPQSNYSRNPEPDFEI